MQLINKTNDTIVANNVVIADTLFKRLRGLLGKKEFAQGQALVLKPCNAIHTFFMHLTIDVLFMDRENRIIKAISCLRPFRLTYIYPRANYAIELPSGTIQATCLREGDILSLES